MQIWSIWSMLLSEGGLRQARLCFLFRKRKQNLDDVLEDDERQKSGKVSKCPEMGPERFRNGSGNGSGKVQKSREKSGEVRKRLEKYLPCLSLVIDGVP